MATFVLVWAYAVLAASIWSLILFTTRREWTGFTFAAIGLSLYFFAYADRLHFSQIRSGLPWLKPGAVNASSSLLILGLITVLYVIRVAWFYVFQPGADEPSVTPHGFATSGPIRAGGTVATQAAFLSADLSLSALLRGVYAWPLLWVLIQFLFVGLIYQYFGWVVNQLRKAILWIAKAFPAAFKYLADPLATFSLWLANHRPRVSSTPVSVSEYTQSSRLQEAIKEHDRQASESNETDRRPGWRAQWRTTAEVLVVLALVGALIYFIANRSNQRTAGVVEVVPASIANDSQCQVLSNPAPFSSETADCTSYTGDSDITQITFFRYASSSSLQSAFENSLNSQKVTSGSPSCGNFEQFVPGCVANWKGTQQAGQIMEYDVSGESYLLFSVVGASTIVEIQEGNSDGTSVLRWWSETPIAW